MPNLGLGRRKPPSPQQIERAQRRKNARAMRVVGFPVTFNASTDTGTVEGLHPENGTPVKFYTDGNMPGGIEIETVYYLTNCDKTNGTFQLSTSPPT